MSNLAVIKINSKHLYNCTDKINYPEWYKFLLFFLGRMPSEPLDRTGTLKNLYKVDEKYQLKMPTEIKEVNLIKCIEDKINRINLLSNNKYIDVFLSGGFDSATMYAGFLQNCDKDKVRAVFTFDEDIKNRKALNQFNPALYKFIIDNKYNYRLINNSDLHPEDSVSVIGHPGNTLSNGTVHNDGYYHGLITARWPHIWNNAYKNKSWKDLIKDIAEEIPECKSTIVVEELESFIEASPIKIKDNPFKILWWIKFNFAYTDRVIGPWYLMTNLSTRRANNVFSFYHSDDFQKYMMYTCLEQGKYIRPEHGRNKEMINYMLSFYKNQSLIDYSNQTPHQKGEVHKDVSKGMIRLNNNKVFSRATFLDNYDSIKEIFYQ
tara:strand:+ start:224 stop:1354 length:1131 start_codon:yes stop_codon:yes gene_type:complete